MGNLICSLFNPLAVHIWSMCLLIADGRHQLPTIDTKTATANRSRNPTTLFFITILSGKQYDCMIANPVDAICLSKVARHSVEFSEDLTHLCLSIKRFVELTFFLIINPQSNKHDLSYSHTNTHTHAQS